MHVAVTGALELKNSSYICIDMYFWWNIEGKTIKQTNELCSETVTL
jgi:hypothetical protein